MKCLCDVGSFHLFNVIICFSFGFFFNFFYLSLHNLKLIFYRLKYICFGR